MGWVEAIRRKVGAIQLILSLVVLGELSANLHAQVGKASTAKGKTVRLLTVGNSFSENATHYLPEMAKAHGHTLIHKSLFVGGAPLDLHWGKVKAFEENPKDPAGLYGSRSLKQELSAEPWDFVTIQQASIKSHDVETYRPFARQLRDYINEHAPRSEVLIHQTWAYRVDDPRFSVATPKAGEPATQADMHRMLTKAYVTIAEELSLRRIPVGDAFHLADTDPKWGYRPDNSFVSSKKVPTTVPDQPHSLHVGWHLTKGKDGRQKVELDCHHANMAGEYLGACVWYEILFGESAVGNRFHPKGLNPEYAAFLQITAHNAMAGAYSESVAVASLANESESAKRYEPFEVASWEHHVTRKDGSVAQSTLKLFSNGGINEPNSKNTWVQKGTKLILRWPDPKAPGGAWEDTCTISGDGKTFSGRNQMGMVVSGKLVSKSNAPIDWDSSTDHVVSHTDNAVAYPRAKPLSNGEILLAYHYGAQSSHIGAWVTLRKSRDGGNTWFSTQDVEGPESAEFWGFCNPDFVELGERRLLLVTAARGKAEPGKPQFLSECKHSELRIRFSDDFGETWGPRRSLVKGRGRLWEPCVVELPNRQLAIYYSNEAPDLARNGKEGAQRLEVITSSDHGKTWSAPAEVSHHKGMRNGMPSVIMLENGQVACAQEIVGDKFSPWITQSVGAKLVKEDYVAQRTCGFGGAPFLLKAPDGSTFLAFQSTHNMPPAPASAPYPWMFANMWVLRGDAHARNFGGATQPWPKTTERVGVFYTSLMIKDDKTIVALATFAPKGNEKQTEIRWIEGKLKP